MAPFNIYANPDPQALPLPSMLIKAASSTSSGDGFLDKPTSNGSHGTDVALRVSQILEEHGIPCCFVGISALTFYGAARVRPVHVFLRMLLSTPFIPSSWSFPTGLGTLCPNKSCRGGKQAVAFGASHTRTATASSNAGHIQMRLLSSPVIASRTEIRTSVSS